MKILRSFRWAWRRSVGPVSTGRCPLQDVLASGGLKPALRAAPFPASIAVSADPDPDPWAEMRASGWRKAALSQAQSGDSHLELDELVDDGGPGDRDPRDGHREGETTRPGASRIEVENTPSNLGPGSMGVTGDHDREGGGNRVEVEVCEVVEQVDEGGLDLDDLGVGQALGPGALVVVAPDGDDRRKLRERCEDLRPADIPGMEDVRAALQGSQGLGPHETMRVRDDANNGSHGIEAVAPQVLGARRDQTIPAHAPALAARPHHLR